MIGVYDTSCLSARFFKTSGFGFCFGAETFFWFDSFVKCPTRHMVNFDSFSGDIAFNGFAIV